MIDGQIVEALQRFVGETAGDIAGLKHLLGRNQKVEITLGSMTGIANEVRALAEALEYREFDAVGGKRVRDFRIGIDGFLPALGVFLKIAGDTRANPLRQNGIAAEAHGQGQLGPVTKQKSTVPVLAAQSRQGVQLRRAEAQSAHHRASEWRKTSTRVAFASGVGDRGDGFRAGQN